MDLADVMDEVAALLDTIPGLRVHAFPGQAVTPPAAVVSYPDEIVFDATYGRGMDRLTLPVVVVVGKPNDRAARAALAGYCNGSGASSVKTVLENSTPTSFDTLRVVRVEFDTVTIAGTDYLAALFETDIAGSGA